MVISHEGRTWFKTLVDLLCSRLVAAEADNRELGLNHAGLDLSHTDRSVHKLSAQGASERVHSVLGRSVDASSGVWLDTSDGPKIDDMTGLLLLEI